VPLDATREGQRQAIDFVAQEIQKAKASAKKEFAGAFKSL